MAVATKVISLRPSRVRSFVPALLVLTAGFLLIDGIVSAVVLSSVVRGEVLSDWLSFYTAGALVWSGHAQHLYDSSYQVAAQQWIFGADVIPMGYPLPAFAATMFAPLSRLTFAQSYFVWLAINVVALAALLLFGWRWLWPLPRPKRIAFLGGTAAIAFIVVVLNAQVELFVVGGMIGCYALLRSGRPLSGGAALAIALFKPHIVAAVILLLLVKRQWRALAGFAAIGAPLLIVPAVLMNPQLLTDQASLLLSYTQSSTDFRVHADMMINIRGPVTALTGSSNVWLWLPPLAVIAGISLFVALYVWRKRQALHPQSWALAFMLPLLYSPHMHFQSVLLLVGAAGLYVLADQRRASPQVAVEHVLAAFVAINALWLLSVFGVPLMAFVIMLAFSRFATRWPRAAARWPVQRPAQELTAAA